MTIDAEPELETLVRSEDDVRTIAILRREVKASRDREEKLHARILAGGMSVAPSRWNRVRSRSGTDLEWKSHRVTLSDAAAWKVAVVKGGRFSVGCTFGGWKDDGKPVEVRLIGDIGRTVTSEQRFAQINVGRRILIVRQNRSKVSDS